MLNGTGARAGGEWTKSHSTERVEEVQFRWNPISFCRDLVFDLVLRLAGRFELDNG